MLPHQDTKADNGKVTKMHYCAAAVIGTTWLLIALYSCFTIVVPGGMHSAAKTGNVVLAAELMAFLSPSIISEELWNEERGIFESPLITAIHHNQVDFVVFLLTNKVSPNGMQQREIRYEQEARPTDESSKTPLAIAIERENIRIVQVLINHGADVNFQSHYFERSVFTPLAVAIYHRQKDIAELLLRAGADPNGPSHRHDKWNLSPLYIAVERGSIDIVRMLIDAKANVNAIAKDRDFVTSSPLQLALEMMVIGVDSTNYREISLVLVANGADVNLCMYEAVKRGKLSLATALLQIGSSASKLALAAAEKSNNDLVRMLVLESNANVNSQDDSKAHGFTCLHYAVISDNIDLVVFLLETQADVLLRTDRGRLPIHFAAALQNSAVLQILLKDATSKNIVLDCINAVDIIGMSPLLISIELGRMLNAELLIQHGADVNAKNLKRQNACHLLSLSTDMKFAEYILTSIIKMLMSVDLEALGDFIDSKDVDGNSPVSLAIGKKNYDFANLLIKQFGVTATPVQIETIRNFVERDIHIEEGQEEL